jgi:hypothetical protein
MQDARIFNKELSATEVSTLYRRDFDFCGQFDIFAWVKWTNTGDRPFIDKKTNACTGFHIGRVGGSVRARINTTNINSSCSAYNDGCWHMIRVYRNSCNLVTLEVDNTAQGCAIVAGDLTNTAPFLIGKDGVACTYFDGAINVIRIYKGKNLTALQATRLYNATTATSIMKLGGRVTKNNQQISKKDSIIQSFGKELGEVEVRAERYFCRTPEFIMRDLIINNTILIPHIHGSPSGIIIRRYNADGKLIDILKDLAALSGKTFSTDALGLWHLHDIEFRNTCLTFTHGICAQNFDEVDDDTEVINDVLIIGERKSYTTVQTFCGDGVTTEFALNEAPVSGVVCVACTEQTPCVDYTFDTLNSKLVFDTCSIPLCSQSIAVTYQYELPLLIRGIKSDSVESNGVKSKRLVMPWIRERNDGVKFINAYLGRFKDIKTSLKITLGTMRNTLKEGDIITLVNDIKGINGTFVIKSITWTYPEMHTEILVGEFKFDDLEYEAQISNKIHDLESALTEVKDLTDIEQLEEVLGLCDTVRIVEACVCGTQYTECLGMTDTIVITELNKGIYGDGVSTYGSTYVYAS